MTTGFIEGVEIQQQTENPLQEIVNGRICSKTSPVYEVKQRQTDWHRLGAFAWGVGKWVIIIGALVQLYSQDPANRMGDDIPQPNSSELQQQAFNYNAASTVSGTVVIFEK